MDKDHKKTFLVPFDGGEASTKASYFALEIAKFEPTKIVFIHQDAIPEEEDEVTIDKDLRKALFDAEISFYVMEKRGGELTDVIVETAEELNADLIIMGTYGNNGTSFDTNTSKIIERAGCSVLAIPYKTSFSKIKRVAFACDFRHIKDSTALMKFWFIALKMKAEIKIVFVNSDRKKVSEFWNEEVERTLEFFFDNFTHDYDIVEGEDIEQAIHNYVHDKNIDLLGILPRNHNKNNLRESTGQLTKLLSTHASIPILALD